MFKKIFSTMAVLSVLAFAGSAMAQTTNTSVTTDSSAVVSKITCVGAAVATREAALDTAMSAHGQAVNAAYTQRANDLAAAYAKTTNADVKAAVDELLTK